MKTLKGNRLVLGVWISGWIWALAQASLAGSITAPCRGSAQEASTDKIWRSCSDVFNGKSDSFESTAIGAGSGTTANASVGILSQIQTQTQSHIDKLYKKLVRCDVSGSGFTSGAETETNHKGKKCGTPLNILIEDISTITIDLRGQYGTLEESYIYGMLPQLNSCKYDQAVRSLSGSYSVAPTFNVSGSCSAVVGDYESLRKTFQSTYGSKLAAVQSCADRENTVVDAAGKQNNFGNNQQVCLQFQSARHALEATFSRAVLCQIFESADEAYKKIAGSSQVQQELIKANVAEVQPTCQEACSPIIDGFNPLTDSVNDLLNELEACANECYQEIGPENMIKFIKSKTQSACGAEISWATLLSVLSLIRKKSRKTYKIKRKINLAQGWTHIIAVAFLAITLGVTGCSSGKSDSDKTQVKDDEKSKEETEDTSNDEAEDIKEQLASMAETLEGMKTQLSTIEGYASTAASGTTVDPSATVTATATVTSTPDPTDSVSPTTSPNTSSVTDGTTSTSGLSAGNSGQVSSGETGASNFATTTSAVNPDNAVLSNSGLSNGIHSLLDSVGLSGLIGSSGSSGSGSKSKTGSTSSYSGAEGESPSVSAISADSGESKKATIAGTIEGVGGSASGSGSNFSSGGSRASGNVDTSQLKGGLTFNLNPEAKQGTNNGRSLASTTGGNSMGEEYFAIIPVSQSIFEVVHRRYESQSMKWVVEDTSTLARLK